MGFQPTQNEKDTVGGLLVLAIIGCLLYGAYLGVIAVNNWRNNSADKDAVQQCVSSIRAQHPSLDVSILLQTCEHDRAAINDRK